MTDNGWVSISDRAPSNGETVDVWYVYDFGDEIMDVWTLWWYKRMIGLKYYVEDPGKKLNSEDLVESGFFDGDGRRVMMKITHWRPLPQRPDGI